MVPWIRAAWTRLPSLPHQNLNHAQRWDGGSPSSSEREEDRDPPRPSLKTSVCPPADPHPQKKY